MWSIDSQGIGCSRGALRRYVLADLVDVVVLDAHDYADGRRVRLHQFLVVMEVRWPLRLYADQVDVLVAAGTATVVVAAVAVPLTRQLALTNRERWLDAIDDFGFLADALGQLHRSFRGQAMAEPVQLAELLGHVA